MSDEKKRFELPSLQSVMDSVKGIINPTGGVPEPDPDDALGLRLERLAVMVKSLNEYQQEFADEMAVQMKEVSDLVAGIYTDIEALRNENQSTDEE
jgi:hypothetical protein